MAGRDHNAPVHAGMGGREVDFLRATETDIVDIHPLFPQARREGALDRLAAETDIVAEHHLARLNDLGEGAAYAARNILIELIRYPAAYIVGLETIQ